MRFDHDELPLDVVSQLGKSPQHNLRAPAKAETLQPHENNSGRSRIRVLGNYAKIPIACEKHTVLILREPEYGLVIGA